MTRYGSIYVATNKHTGEQYVGQTRQSVQKRWAAHWRTAICSASRKAASEFLGVLRTSVTNAVKQKGKVAGKYTLVRVA